MEFNNSPTDSDAEGELELITQTNLGIIEERETSPDLINGSNGDLKVDNMIIDENSEGGGEGEDSEEKPKITITTITTSTSTSSINQSNVLTGIIPTGDGRGRWRNAARIDNSYVSSPPILLPHTAHLPESQFEFYTTRSHPINKNNFRYTPCGPSPTSDLPITIQRTIESSPQNVRFSWEDRSSFVLISESAQTITAEKGWRAARGNVGIREGNWYWEVKVDRGGGEGGRSLGGEGEGSWVRTGVGRRESPLNAPVGIDGHSYAYRDRGGEAVTLARPVPYGTPFKSGSTIGIYISLPSRPTPSPTTEDRRDPARIVRKRIPIRYKGQLYFESLEYTSSKDMEDLSVDPATKTKEKVEELKAAAPGTKSRPPPEDLSPPPRELPKLNQSKIAFFLDGVCQGVAFENIYDFLPLRLHPGQREKRKGTLDAHLKIMENWHDDGFLGYFPLVSVFGGGIATINPGPDFEFPPPDDIEVALRNSSRPPKTEEIIIERKEVQEGEGEERSKKSWRPLCERYAEALSEQRKLDDLDEIEATKLFQKAASDDALGIILPSQKKGKFSNTPAARLASLGVVLLKTEPATTNAATPLSQNGTPGASPLPQVVKEVKHRYRSPAVVKVLVEEEDGEGEREGGGEEIGEREEVMIDYQKAWRGTRSDFY